MNFVPSSLPAELPDTFTDLFGFIYPSTVQFGDLDVLGHVNNLTYLRIAQTSRVDYLQQICDAPYNGLTYVLARVTVDFRAQGFYKDELVCGTRVSRLGTKSFDVFQQIMRIADGQVMADVNSVMVALADDQVTSQPIADAWRQGIIAFEPVTPDGVATL
ncbi:MAG: acyl-CoA thioesterase [Nitriliruptoraceae bacterium]